MVFSAYRIEGRRASGFRSGRLCWAAIASIFPGHLAAAVAPASPADPSSVSAPPSKISSVYGPSLQEAQPKWAPVPSSSVQGLAEAAPALPSSWTFERLIQEIVTNNPRIRAQSAGAKAAGYEVAIARWQYFPTPSVQAETFGTDRQITASLSQPLLSFGRLSTDLKAAQARAGLAQDRVEEARFSLSFRVLDLYSQFIAASRSAEVMRGDVRRLSDMGEMISRRVTAGVSAPVDLNLVLTRIRQSENAVISLEARRASALAGLSELLGKPIAAEEIILPDGSSISRNMELVAGDASGLISRSLGYNPILRRAEHEVNIARIDRQRVANAMKPTFNVRLEQSMNNGRYDTSTLPRTRALFGVQYSFGSGLSSLSRVKSASAQADSARLAREATVSDARTALLTDLETLDASRQLVGSLRTNLKVQEDTVDSYNRLFLAGKRSWLDVLNMARELTGSERDLADAETQMLVTTYRLLLQTGQIAGGQGQ